MGLHDFTFMRRNSQNKKKLTPLRIMNIVSIFNDSVAIDGKLRNNTRMDIFFTNFLAMNNYSCA